MTETTIDLAIEVINAFTDDLRTIGAEDSVTIGDAEAEGLACALDDLLARIGDG